MYLRFIHKKHDQIVRNATIGTLDWISSVHCIDHMITFILELFVYTEIFDSMKFSLQNKTYK